MLQKLNVKGNRILLVILFVTVWHNSLWAQPDCRSILGLYIKPLGNTFFSWGAEFTGAGAFMNDRTIANGSVFAGVDYSKGLHTVYFEGAYKNWYNSAVNPDGNPVRTGLPGYNRPTPRNFGFRELFYSYGIRSSHVRVGVQSFRSPDFLIFDERMLGVSVMKNVSYFRVTAAAGTVTQRIARYQDLCGNRHIYNILHQSQFNFVGQEPGDSNFAALFLSWKPGTANPKASVSDDEFEEIHLFDDNEFSESEFNEQEEKNQITTEQIGIFFYQEFGKGFHENKYYPGIFSTFKFPAGFSFKAELIHQYILNDHTTAFWMQLDHFKLWNNGSSSGMKITCLTRYNWDDGARFYPAFSNLFLGEVMRLDAINLPLLSGTMKHRFDTKWKPAFQLNLVKQLHGNHSGEMDFIADVRPLRNIRLTTIASYLQSDLLQINYWMARMEVRLAF